jgi:ABC-type multidrug transport system fused ATPase/permease subunit
MTVAHRLSTIRNLDWEFVIDKGRMVEEGSFHMLGDDGQFRSAHLVAMQKL